jgi:acyl-CoA thioesterase-1
MRYLVGFVCVLALGVMPVVGCGETEGTGGSGGSAGIGGVGGGGGGTPATEAVRVAFIGDSITEPVGTPTMPVNYPEHLVSLLGDEFDLGNFGVGGATMSRVGSSSYWDLPEFAEAKASEPHVVTIMLGTNDTKPAIWDADAYEQDYRDMVEEMESLPSKPTLLLLRPAPVFGVNAFLIRGDVLRDEVLPIIDRLGVEYDLVVVDLYTPLLEHGDLFPDNVHPTAAGGLLIAERLIEPLVSAASARGFEITRNASPIAAE